VCSHFARKFDIWANRGIQVVWGDSAVGGYDQWLINYAEAWLEVVSARKLYSLVVPLDSLLAALRLALTRRVEWWKAEARRYVAEQKVDFARKTAGPETGPKQRKGRPPDKMLKARQELIRRVAAGGLEGAAYCEALGKAGLSTSIRWQKNEGCPKNYLEAFNHVTPALRKKWRNRIANEKYLASLKKSLV